jgi:PleD family two-component response regulator
MVSQKTSETFRKANSTMIGRKNQVCARLLHPYYVRSIRKSEKMETNKVASLPTGSLRVLVIDDEKNIRTTLSLCLEQMGCTVTAVPGPDPALATLRQQSYELVEPNRRVRSARY